MEPTYEVSLLDALGDRADEIGANLRWVPGNDPVNGANMIETADMTAIPSSALTPEAGSGRGLTARYWDNPTFQGAEDLTRTERQVAYDVGFVGGSPAFANLYASQVPATPAITSATGADQSAVYTGFFTAPRTGTYRLGLTGWGDASLFLDGELLVENAGSQRWEENAEVALEAGRALPDQGRVLGSCACAAAARHDAAAVGPAGRHEGAVVAAGASGRAERGRGDRLPAHLRDRGA